MNKIIKRILQYLFMIAFFLLITTFFWGKQFYAYEKESWLRIEVPVAFPETETTTDKLNFFTKLDKYIETNFPLQKTGKKLYNYIIFNIFRETYSSEVLVGREGWLFRNGPNVLTSHQRTNATPKFTNNTYAAFQAIDQYAESRGMKFVLIIAPDKGTIYPEYFMEGIDRFGEYQLAELIIQLNEEAEDPLTILYPMEELVRAKDSNIMFYETDIHWTNFAALVSIETMIEELQDPALIEALANLNFKEKPYRMSGLYWGMLGIDIWGMELNSETNDIFVQNPNATEISLDTSCPDNAITHYQVDSPGSPNAIFIHDSFGNAMVNFLPELHSNFIDLYLNRCKHPSALMTLDEITDEMQIDYLIMVANERSLHSTNAHHYQLAKLIEKMDEDE